MMEKVKAAPIFQKLLKMQLVAGRENSSKYCQNVAERLVPGKNIRLRDFGPFLCYYSCVFKSNKYFAGILF